MLKYFKKFVLDILPSVAATIIGAYIVHHYVIPAASPQGPAAAVAGSDSKPDAVDNGSFAKGVAEKAAIEKTAEKAAAIEPSTDLKRRHAAPRAANRATPENPSVVEPATIEERRDANELARAAIERLRPAGEPVRAIAAPVQPLRELNPAPSTSTITAAPASDVFDAGARPLTGGASAPQAKVRSADATRPLPPADIPAAPPLELHDDAPSVTRTVAEDVISAAKSVFHAVLPR